MHNWGASKARLMSGLSAQLQLLDLACHTHSDQPCKNYRLHWFLVFICEGLWVCMHVLMSGCVLGGFSHSCTACVYTVTHTVYICVCVGTVCGCDHMCSAAEQDVNQVWEPVQEWVMQPHLELRVRVLQMSSWGCRQTHEARKPQDHFQLLLLCSDPQCSGSTLPAILQRLTQCVRHLWLESVSPESKCLCLVAAHDWWLRLWKSCNLLCLFTTLRIHNNNKQIWLI